MTKVYLDDEREVPDDSWTLVKTTQEAIDLLRKGGVKTISLDHDLGDNTNGTGYDVLCYIEEFMMESGNVPYILIHTGNASARVKMEAAVKRIERELSK